MRNSRACTGWGAGQTEEPFSLKTVGSLLWTSQPLCRGYPNPSVFSHSLESSPLSTRGPFGIASSMQHGKVACESIQATSHTAGPGGSASWSGFGADSPKRGVKGAQHPCRVQGQRPCKRKRRGIAPGVCKYRMQFFMRGPRLSSPSVRRFPPGARTRAPRRSDRSDRCR